MKNKILLKFYRIKDGLKNSITKPFLYPYSYIHIGLSLILMKKIEHFDFGEQSIRTLLRYIIIAVVMILIIISFIDILLRIGTPIGSKKTHQNLHKIGLKNSIGEIPWLISKIKLKNKNAIVNAFMNNGISLEEFEKKKEKIEATLNLKIFDIEYVDGKIKVKLVTTSHDSFEMIHWKKIIEKRKTLNLFLVKL